MRTYHEFDTAASAIEYRRNSGCGGWIFDSEKTGKAIIFPFDMTPSQIFAHPFCKGMNGNLIGCL
jgi:hypothetical protein